MQVFKNKIITLLCFTLLIFASVVGLQSQVVYAADEVDFDDFDPEDLDYYYKNPETGFEAYIIDTADVYKSSSMKRELFEQMKLVTAYGNAVYISLKDNPYSHPDRFTQEFYEDNFKVDESLFLFCSDRENRWDYIRTGGDMTVYITNGHSLSITDNIYRYEHDEAGIKCFEQANTILKGGKIAQPMKYICNALLAFLCAFLINFGIVTSNSKLTKNVSRKTILSGCINTMQYNSLGRTHLKQTKRYSPQSRGGGGGSGGGGRSGGGGGRSGGGGHRH